LTIVSQDQLVRLILASGKKEGLDVRGIWVIGSYARGKKWPNDYDIYVYAIGDAKDREYLTWDLEGYGVVTSWGALHVDPIAIYEDVPPDKWPKKRLWPPQSWAIPYYSPPDKGWLA